MGPVTDFRAILEQLDLAISEEAVERLPVILAALSARGGAVAARMIDGQRTAPADAEPERNLSVREAARRLGVSADFLYDHAKELPFAVRIGRRLLFSSRGLDRWNRQRQNQ
jgi:excisionase family DNA binding protein